LDVARRRGFVPLEKCLESETEIGVRACDALDACYTRFGTDKGRTAKKMARAIRTGNWRG